MQRGAQGPFGMRDGAVRTWLVPEARLRAAHGIYMNDPTMQACREVLHGVLFAGDIRFSAGGAPLEVASEFLEFVKRHWISFGRDALDHLRMFGFVPYVLRACDDGVNFVPLVPPLGSYAVELSLDEDFQRGIRMLSRMGDQGEVARSHFYVHQWPTLEGELVSPLMTLVPGMVRCDILMNAAVEADVAGARPVLLTQAQRATSGATRSNGTSNQQSVAVATGVSEWFSDTVGEMAGLRRQEQDVDTMDRLRDARAMAISFNKTAVSSQTDPLAQAMGGRSSAAGLAGAAVMTLPEGLEVANAPQSHTAQNILLHSAALVDTICGVMGVPNSLIHPASSSYNSGGLVQRMVNAELVRQADLLSSVLTQAYAGLYGGGGGGGAPRVDGRKRRGVARHSGVAGEHVVPHIAFAPFMQTETIAEVVATGLFTHEYGAELMARAGGFWHDGEARQHFAPPPAAGAGAGAAPAPARTPAAAPRVVAKRARAE
jgi:hypothetical protein